MVHAEDSGKESVAPAEVAEEGMARPASTAVRTRMATGEEEDMVDMVPELEVMKAPRTGRGALGNPTRGEAVVVGTKASLVMILRGRLEGTMSATAAQAVGMR